MNLAQRGGPIFPLLPGNGRKRENMSNAEMKHEIGSAADIADWAIESGLVPESARATIAGNETDRATPRPWHNGGQVVFPDDRAGRTIAVLPDDDARVTQNGVVYGPCMTIDEQRANAALIVRAVNAHDKLVDACEAVLAAMPSGCRATLREIDHRSNRVWLLRQLVRAALALARGVTK